MIPLIPQYAYYLPDFMNVSSHSPLHRGRDYQRSEFIYIFSKESENRQTEGERGRGRRRKNVSWIIKQCISTSCPEVGRPRAGGVVRTKLQELRANKGVPDNDTAC